MGPGIGGRERGDAAATFGPGIGGRERGDMATTFGPGIGGSDRGLASAETPKPAKAAKRTVLRKLNV